MLANLQLIPTQKPAVADVPAGDGLVSQAAAGSERSLAAAKPNKYRKSTLKIAQKRQERRQKKQAAQGTSAAPSTGQNSRPNRPGGQQPKGPDGFPSKKKRTNVADRQGNAKEADVKIEETPVETKEAEVFAKVDQEEKNYVNFDDLPINDKLKEVLKMNNFSQLTKIQRDAIPVLLKNRNTILRSETGSGKTLAYLVPLIEYLSHYSLNIEKIKREASGTMAIIFSPTRELAAQIDIELRKLLKLFYYMVCTTLMGGESAKTEKARLRKGCVILICTPGRFLYHLQNTKCLKLDNLQYLIFDEADRMLDAGFEREMNQCLNLIKQKCSHKFLKSDKDGEKAEGEEKYWSDEIKMNFVSATMNHKIEALGNRLMERHVKVGFANAAQAGQKGASKSQSLEEGAEPVTNVDTEKEEINDLVASMPKQVVQYFVQIPIQYRLLYLLSFLYAHQHEKVIVFASNCELVNFLEAVVKSYDWNRCGRREEPRDSKTPPADSEDAKQKQQLVFGGNIFKLHGDMNHEHRKMNYFGFDKIEPGEGKQGGVLVCTDVASRGLDFKGVAWILQYDLSSQIKEYINRVGRTARIAASGSSLCFVMPNEANYAEHLRKKYSIQLHEKNRFNLVKEFELVFAKNNPTLKHHRFRRLMNIEDPDEQQESMHAVREHLKYMMLDQSLGLKNMGQIARASSTRAYAGHSSEMRHIFSLQKLNLTEFARSFGLYKQLYQSAQRERENQKKDEKKEMNQKLIGSYTGRVADMQEKAKEIDLEKTIKENQTLYSRRLQKSKIKDLEREMRSDQNKEDRKKMERLQEELKKARTDVFTDERKILQRTAGFQRAKSNIKKTYLSEFM